MVRTFKQLFDKQCPLIQYRKKVETRSFNFYLNIIKV